MRSRSLTPPRLVQSFLATLVLALGIAAVLAAPSSAATATKCGEKVLADWYDNGRVDKLYPANCYEEAIDAIPDDIGPYVDAEDVITRALQASLNGHLAPGGDDPTPGDDNPNGSGGGKGGDKGGGQNPDGDPSDPTNPTAAPTVDTSGPSSVPIPLLVLGGMSIVLLAAGGLGYVSRRRQAAREDDPDDSDTLA